MCIGTRTLPEFSTRFSCLTAVSRFNREAEKGAAIIGHPLIFKFSQRFMIYIVTSKPKRISLYKGFSQTIVSPFI